MNRKLVSLLLLSGLTWGCSDSNNVAVTSDLNPTPAVMHIAVIAPLNAGLTSFGKGILNSVQLAVDEANASHPLPGITLTVLAEDDSSTPSVGAAAAQSLLGDTSLIGVVGTYNSGVAAAVLPILSPTQIAMISPANTDPTLTQGADPSNPVRPYADYFRVVVPDTIQGPALARYAFAQGFTRVAIVSEDKSVSLGLANNFQTTFVSLGGAVTTYQTVPAGTTDYSSILTTVAATNPQLLFYGGEYQGAALVRDQASAAGLTVPLMGGDGVKDPAYVAAAGAVSEGDFASSVGAPPSALPNAAAYFAAYQQAGYPDPPSDFGPYAFDAANLLIEGARGKVSAGVALDASFRTALLASVQASQPSGITGPLAFDAFGDTKNKVVTIYKVVGGAFQPEQTVTVP